MILGLIPARGGSKGIKNKAICLFCGKPLLAHSVEIGLACSFIDEVVVSTEDSKIAEVGRAYGAKTLCRPIELAQDDTPMMPVLRHACENYSKAEVVILLDPTNPLRIVKDVEGAYKLFKKGDCDAVVSGVSVPSFNLVNSDDGFVWQLFHRDQFTGCRQHCLETIYNLDSTIWIYSREAVLAGKRIPPKTELYLVPPERSASIDTELDWKITEYLYMKNHYV